jgi:ABC-type Fe3+/spermidine/putrescine transport system ATPase subunit
VLDIPAHKRDAGMVFQDYALFPHMTVGENIAFGLKRHGYEGDRIDDRIAEMLRLVDMEGFADRQPSNLSGGQQQRVATARAVALEPTVLLMDEPLGALDRKLRDQLQVELTELQSDLGITTLYVTHNQSEALTMADRVAVMNDGRIEQLAPPRAIYEEPATEFVADFIGDTNFLSGRLTADDDGAALETTEATIRVNADRVPDGAVAFVRPEKITVGDPDARREDAVGSRLNRLTGTVSKVIFLGSKVRYYVDVGDQELIAETENRGAATQYEEGDAVSLAWERIDTQLVGG